MDLAWRHRRRPAHRLAPARRRPPRPHPGTWRAGPTGLRLLVASDPPRLVEVDRGTSRRVGGLLVGTGSSGDGDQVKFMSMAWTDDGRLVLAGDFDRFGKALAVWRPGRDHLAVRRLALPAFAGSDTFIPLARS